MNDAFKQPFSLFLIIAAHHLLCVISLGKAPY